MLGQFVVAAVLCSFLFFPVSVYTPNSLKTELHYKTAPLPTLGRPDCLAGLTIFTCFVVTELSLRWRHFLSTCETASKKRE